MISVEPKLHSIPESAKVLNICDSYLWRLVRENRIESIKIGKRRFITPATLQALLNGEINLAQ
jgi:excisionase family DNA binding protein